MRACIAFRLDDMRHMMSQRPSHHCRYVGLSILPAAALSNSYFRVGLPVNEPGISKYRAAFFLGRNIAIKPDIPVPKISGIFSSMDGQTSWASMA